MSDPFDVALHEAVDEYFREKGGGDDDHFYGAWSGGSKASGGHATKTKAGLAGATARVDAQEPKPKAKPGLKDATERVTKQPPHHSSSWDPDEAYVDQMLSGLPKTGKPGTGAVVVRSHTGPRFVGTYYGDDGRAVGYVSFKDTASNPAMKGAESYIGEVSIRPSARGSGNGFKLYDYMQDHTPHNMYDLIGQSHDFTPAGKAFAQSWLSHRAKLEAGNA